MAALSRPPPRGSGSDPPPPVLPPRPGARTLRPPPATPPAPPAQTNDSDPEDDVDPTTGGPDEIYDDCNEETPGDVYDDCDENKPPAAPEVYDDCDEQPPLPARPPARPPPSLPPALPPQETYDDLDNVGPIVQQLPKKSNRLLPPTPPPSAKQVEVVEEVYEATEDFQPTNIRHDPVVTPLHKRGPPPHNNDDPVVVPCRKTGSSPPRNEPALTPVHKRTPSPPKHRPPERSRKSSSPPAALLPPFPGRQPSPGRRVSPSRPDIQDLPSALPPVEEKGRVESHPNPGPSLPPIPPIGSGRSTSPAPVPTARANRKAKENEDSSPVVVPLKNRQKGALPPLPPAQSEKPSFRRAPFKPDNGEAATAPLSWRGAEQEQEEEEEEDAHQKQIDAGPVPPQPVNETVESFYELGNDEETLLPPPPLPPHKDDKRGDPRLHSQPARAAPGPKSPGGGFAIDLNQLQGLKAGLRKVSVGSASEANNNDPKTYGECVQSVSEAKKKFQEKVEAVKPVIQSPKPAFLPKKPERVSTSTTDATSTSNTNAVKPNSLSSGSKPAPAVQQVSPHAPDVTFLPKASKDKDKDKVPLLGSRRRSITR